ncbi:MAG: hypothetical protein CNE98_04160 [Bacteroidetes bacterium MED-G17]|nr:MAG: hypothetical protein CNE98_04160 [Bacteroidetes bacterium MED-G17]CAI8352894.1 MAG: Uncharacterised protein [Bacteroidetes bacterium MED-G17]|tara:strand:+ start:7935 stop:8306 length:372 start_codon:yes stop_codon:yes gene_type:complete
MTIEGSQKKLEKLQKELLSTASVLKVASQRLIGANATKYPIFIAFSKIKIGYGISIIEAEEYNLDWSINLATLEDFIDWQFIPSDRVNFFKETFKNPADFACIFLATEDLGKFIFYPYSKDEA